MERPRRQHLLVRSSDVLRLVRVSEIDWIVRELRHWFGGDYQVLLRDGAELRLSRNYRERLDMYFVGDPPSDPRGPE